MARKRTQKKGRTVRKKGGKGKKVKKGGTSRSRKKKVPAWSKGKGQTGLVHIHTGDGKGKTMAAVGQVVRAAGQGLSCCFIQFMKGKYPYGEVKVLKRLKNVTVKQFGTLEFVRKGKPRKVDITEATKALDHAKWAMFSGLYDLVVLDEVCVAVFMDLLTADEVIVAVGGRAPAVEVILTGRKAGRKLRNIADYVTDFRKVAHPFDNGVLARKGIEY